MELGPVPWRSRPVTWVFSTLVKLKQEQRRRERMMRASQELDDLEARLEG